MIEEPLFAVWIQTEGLDLSPILCTDVEHSTNLVAALDHARIISGGELIPCCRNDDNTACARDQWTPDELDRPTEIIMRAAMAAEIVWPADLGKVEPEYSVLSDG